MNSSAAAPQAAEAAGGPPEDGAPAADPAPTDADWGLGEAKGRFSKETLIGAALVVVLLWAFGFVVYTKVDQRRQDADLLAKPPKHGAPREQERPEPLDQPPAGRTARPSNALPQPSGFEPVAQRGGAQDPFATTAFPSQAGDRQTPHAAPYQTASNVIPVQGEPSIFGGEPLPPDQPSGGVASLEPEVDPFASGAAPWDQAATSPSGAPPAASPSDQFPTQAEPLNQEFPTGGADTAGTASLDPFGGTSPGAAPQPTTSEAEFGNSSGTTAETPGGFLPPVESVGVASGGHPIEPNPLPADPEAGHWDASSAVHEAAGQTAVLRPGSSMAVDINASQPVQCAGQATGVQAADPFDPSYAPAPSPDPIPATRGGLPTAGSEAAGIYEVRPQDSFWSISRSQYGTARYYVALARYNADRIPDTGKMRPGMKVLIPPREVLEARYPDVSRGQAATGAAAANRLPSGFHVGPRGEPLYRVGAQDTLGEIAKRHLGRSSRWTHIYELNRDVLNSPNDLTIGTTLKLPADASRVQTASNPRDVW